MSALYRGSVKDLMGPVQVATPDGPVTAVSFEYTDAYSVFDWGRMPDALARKGEALAVLAAELFERLEKAETWREFSRSPEALGLRKGNRFGAAFNEVGEELQAAGLRTHYLGLLPAPLQEGQAEAAPQALGALAGASRSMLVRRVSVVKPTFATVLGRSLPDYFPTNRAEAPRLVPLEVVFRFGVPEGSSLVERVQRDPAYLAQLGFPEARMAAGVPWEFPVLELFTKLESADRPVPLTEALPMSGLSAAGLQRLLFKTAWVAGALRWICSSAGLTLGDGKLEWGVDASGETFLVDAIGPDELRLSKHGVQFSKEFLRSHYRGTGWYAEVLAAKARAQSQGAADWKRGVSPPPKLPTDTLILATQVYLSLANALTGRKWFKEAWNLDQVAQQLVRFAEQNAGGTKGSPLP